MFLYFKSFSFIVRNHLRGGNISCEGNKFWTNYISNRQSGTHFGKACFRFGNSRLVLCKNVLEMVSRVLITTYQNVYLSGDLRYQEKIKIFLRIESRLCDKNANENQVGQFCPI